MVVVSRDQDDLVFATPAQLREKIAEIDLGATHLVRAERDHVDSDPHVSVSAPRNGGPADYSEGGADLRARQARL